MKVNITEDDSRDLAIALVDELVGMGLLPDCTDTDDETEFEMQDIFQDIIIKKLGLGL